MRRQIQVIKAENKLTKSNVPFVNFTTSSGVMSCWDHVLSEQLKRHIGQMVEVEAPSSPDGRYTNIRGFYSVLSSSPEKVQPSVVPPVHNPPLPKVDNEPTKATAKRNRIQFFENEDGNKLSEDINTFSLMHEVFATQTGVKGDKFYAFVWWKGQPSADEITQDALKEQAQ